MSTTEWSYVFVVFRVDRWRLKEFEKLEDDRLDSFVVIKEVLCTEQEAAAEVARLSALKVMAESEYFYRRTKFYPDGRKNTEQ